MMQLFLFLVCTCKHMFISFHFINFDYREHVFSRGQVMHLFNVFFNIIPQSIEE